MILQHETTRLHLRTLMPEEASLALAYYTAARDFLEAYEPARDEQFFTLEHQSKLLTAEQHEMDSLRMLRFWMFLKDGTIERPIGTFAFSNIVRGAFLSTFLGYKLDSEHLRQGYMFEALEKGIDLMFNTYGLHRIEANIMPSNTPSLALTKKLGFQEEGLAKQYLRINGIWEDHLHMVLLNHRM